MSFFHLIIAIEVLLISQKARLKPLSRSLSPSPSSLLTSTHDFSILIGVLKVSKPFNGAFQAVNCIVNQIRELNKILVYAFKLIDFFPA
jgi:hypothetical protein